MTAQECIFELAASDRTAAPSVTRPDLWELYNTAMKCRWSRGEINYVGDMTRVTNLKKTDKHAYHMLTVTLGFFISADAPIAINAGSSFLSEVPLKEAMYFYIEQAATELIHALTYNDLIENLIADRDEQDALRNSRNTIPAVGAIADWIDASSKQPDGPTAPLQERIWRFACTEGIIFCSSFCIVYWFAKYCKIHGLCQSNELIARDEALHTRFGVGVDRHVRESHKLSLKRRHEITAEAVELTIALNREAMGTGKNISNMNADMMEEYIKNQANVVLALGGYSPLYPGAKNPFSFMEQLNLENRASFLERSVTDYSAAPVDQHVAGASESDSDSEDF